MDFSSFGTSTTSIFSLVATISSEKSEELLLNISSKKSDTASLFLGSRRKYELKKVYSILINNVSLN